ncbi:MAG: M14 family zinc carboxypeptidase [candidate division WOR-3 bacterium]
MKFVKSIFMLVILKSLLFSYEKIVRVYISSWEELLNSLRPVFGKTIPEVVSVKKGTYFDLLLDGEDFLRFKRTGLKFEIIIDDLEKLKEIYRGQYHSYSEVVTILRNYASSYPAIAKLESTGTSYENRWLYGIKISDNVNVDEDEPEHLFTGCTHAREWASIEVALFIADTLLKGYGTDPLITQIVNTREVWVFPIINPDGYVYDYPNQRSWRKNRQPFHGYIGTDLNRNYNGAGDTLANAGWGWIYQGSASHYPNDQTFCGFKGFSSPEIFYHSSFVKSRKFNSAIDYHSYGEVVLMPWGYLQGPTPHDSWIQAIASGMASRIQRLGGGTYSYEYALYPVTGNARDWYYGWNNFVNGNPCIGFVIEVGTSFYQPVSDLDHIMRQNFNGALFLMQKGDSIKNYMKCFVPSPSIEPLDTVPPNFNLIWHPRNKETNNPLYWEIRKYQNPVPQNESFESGTGLWVIEGFQISNKRAHSGNYSLRSDSVNQSKSQARTKYPYFVKEGDSLIFWVWYSLENEYDVAIVEVSEDKREWIPLVSERWTGNSNNWVRYSYSLDAWAGKSLYFRWRVMTDESVLNDGFYIDDIYPVPNWQTIQTVATQIYDTIYSFTNYPDGTYYFSVRGYSSQFGWGNWSPLEEVIVSSTKVCEKNMEIYDLKFSQKDFKILYSFNEFTPLRIYVYDISGRNLKSYNFNKLKGSGEINLEPLFSKGIYILKLKIGKKGKNFKFFEIK